MWRRVEQHLPPTPTPTHIHHTLTSIHGTTDCCRTARQSIWSVVWIVCVFYQLTSLKQLIEVLSLHAMAHRYLCHEHHPSGGVSAAPLSSADTRPSPSTPTKPTHTHNIALNDCSHKINCFKHHRSDSPIIFVQ